MWDMRRNLNTTPMPPRRSVVQFAYPELPSAQRCWWLLVDPETGAELPPGTPSGASHFGEMLGDCRAGTV